MGLNKYNTAKRSSVLRNGTKDEIGTTDKDKILANSIKQLEKARKTLEEKIKINDEKGIAKANDIIANLEGLIGRMTSR